MGGAGVALGAAGGHSGFEESRRARLTLRLSGGCCLNVFAWWTLNFTAGSAGVGLETTLRCIGFEKSGCAGLALRLGGGGTDCLSVLARWAFGVSLASDVGTMIRRRRHTAYI